MIVIKVDGKEIYRKEDTDKTSEIMIIGEQVYSQDVASIIWNNRNYSLHSTKIGGIVIHGK